VLKQVWNLSDQDGDSMLSVREFCTALYLMERFREGRPPPPILPPGIHLDDPPGPGVQMSAAQRPVYGGSNWQQQGNSIHLLHLVYNIACGHWSRKIIFLAQGLVIPAHDECYEGCT